MRKLLLFIIRFKRKTEEERAGDWPHFTPFYLGFPFTIPFLHCMTVNTVHINSNSIVLPGRNLNSHKKFRRQRFSKHVVQRRQSRNIFCEIFTWTFLVETHLQRSARKPFISMAIISPGCCSREKLWFKSRGRDPEKNHPIFQCEDHSSIVITARPICHRYKYADELPCVNIMYVRCRRVRQAWSKRAEGNAI